MDQQNPTLAKTPILDTGKFEQWKFRIQQYLQHEHYALWEVIEFGDSYVVPASTASAETTNTASDGTGKKKGRTVTLTTKDMQKRKNDVKARTTLLLSLFDEDQLRFSKHETAQELWAAILKTFGGNEATKKTKKNLLKQQYGNFKAKGLETLEGLEYKTESSDDYIEILKKKLELIKKEKESLDGKLAGFQTASKDLDSLLENQRLDKNKEGLGYSAVPPPPAQIYSSPKKDLSWTGLLEIKDDTVTDYSRHAPIVESSLKDAQNRNPSVTETEASPTAISPKSFIKFVKTNDSPSNSKIDKAKTAKKSPVKKFSTVNRKFPTAYIKLPTGGTKFHTADMGKKGKAVKPSACWFWKPSQNLSNKGPTSNNGSSQNNIDDKGYWDIGCSRHMTGNISYLSDFEPFDEGYVYFGQGGCKITGKETIKIGKLEFKYVYFVKDLKYNLFSVSQIRDNKNSVLFTDSECIVLGRNFKLSDDDNVLLRTPRQHNMYSIDFKNIVSHKYITCLVAKASADECADNCPSMLEKDMYDSWKSRMELYMVNRPHGRMILESVEQGPLLWPSVEVKGVTRLKKYSELSAAEAIQADCDVKATNIILQGLPPE
nr:ribonuclease H-like domain-containing protein [Tanacetum cinerariifolium]